MREIREGDPPYKLVQHEWSGMVSSWEQGANEDGLDEHGQ